MTHEYTIATNGLIVGAHQPGATAVAWAEGIILAVGDEAAVRGISRGDSTFVDLAGRAVTLGRETEGVLSAYRSAVADRSVRAMIASGGAIEVGAPADLLIWSHDPLRLLPGEAASLELAGAVCGGRLRFSE